MKNPKMLQIIYNYRDKTQDEKSYILERDHRTFLYPSNHILQGLYRVVACELQVSERRRDVYNNGDNSKTICIIMKETKNLGVIHLIYNIKFSNENYILK